MQCTSASANQAHGTYVHRSDSFEERGRMACSRIGLPVHLDPLFTTHPFITTNVALRAIAYHALLGLDRWAPSKRAYWCVAGLSFFPDMCVDEDRPGVGVVCTQFSLLARF
jgi:hypothetical protein